MTKSVKKLTRRQVADIRATFNALQPKVREASQIFYERLFEIAPELRGLFRSDIEGQGMRFMTALGAILDHIDDPEALNPHLRRLAQGHAAYGVRPENFRPMGEALIWTMRDVLGDDLGEAAEAAWEKAYDRLADEMIALAGDR